MISRTQVLLFLVAAAAVAAIAGTTYGAFSSTTSNGGNSFQAASSFCTAINPVWMTGFEHGFVSASGEGQFTSVVSTGGAPVADNGVTRTSVYSLKIHKTGVLGGSYVQLGINASTVVTRFALRLASAPATDVSLAFILAGTDLVLGYDSATDKLELTSGFSAIASTNSVSAGPWYVIDMKASFGSNPNTVEWRINGTEQTSLSSAVASSTASAIGWGTRALLETYTANYDDFLVSLNGSDYPLANGRILGLPPNAAAHPVTNFADDDGTALDVNSWQRIAPPMTSSDYIKQTAVAGSGYVQVDFSNTTECVRAVFATVAYNSSGGTALGKTSIFDGTSEAVVHSGDMSPTALTYKMIRIDPVSSPWTQTAVNALVARIGYSTDLEPHWHGVGLEYETDP